MTFSEFKQKFQQNFPKSGTLFQVDVTREQLWDTFINAFPAELQQEYTCNCCKSFLRQYGNIVTVVDGKNKSIWNIVLPFANDFSVVCEAMTKLTEQAPITDIFVSRERYLGTDQSNTIKEGRAITWQHMYAANPVVYSGSKSEDSVKGEARTLMQVFKRALDEVSANSVETVLELIAQNSLYRGTEYNGILNSFLTLKRKYTQLSESEKIPFAWINSIASGGAVSSIRNSAVGTLLTNIDEGMELDTAVSKFEALMAPANYKRPTAIVTKGMIEKAEKTINELGLTDSLGRRFAHKDDITVNEVLFVDRSVSSGSIFDQLKEEELVNPKTLSKVEEITIDNFLEKVLPTATGIEVLVENRHKGNFMSLIAAQNPGAPNLFKWNNPFSWCYSGGIADSMKDRVKAAGGNVSGVLRFSIQWNDEDTKYNRDMDAHAHEPDGTHIYFSSGYRGDSGNRRTSMTGQLDVDMTGGPNVMVENITWTDKSKMKDGDYRLRVKNYSGVTCNGIKAQVEMDGELHEFFYSKSFTDFIDIAVVTLRNGVFSIKSSLDSSSRIQSQNVWGINTMRFHKVNMITQSPNFWGENAIGNRHTFFFIDKVHNDEIARGFFNEYLKPELDVHRKVFEVLSSKLKVAPSDVQVSGLGYSSTKKDEVIVKVTGTFTRTLKIKF